VQESLLPFLRCPVTRSELSVRIIKKTGKFLGGNSCEVIEEGILYSEAGWFYPIIHGVPRLTVEAIIDHGAFLKAGEPDFEKRKALLFEKHGELIRYAVKKNKRTKASFTKEWSLYDPEKDNTWDAGDAGIVDRFLKETAETKDSLKGRLIFDAGCGNAKLEKLIAADCGSIVAMDLSDYIEDAWRRNEHANVHFVQGDVQYPPVAQQYFDIVHCSGVLIHTNNTRRSFAAIETAVKKGGKLSVWLYHPRRDLIHRAFNSIRKRTSKLPLGFQYYLYMCTLLPVSYCIKRLKGNKQNIREMKLSILDWFTPEFRWEHEHSEVRSWFLESSYRDIRITTVDKFGFNITGEKQ
jgi:SAM-dependent methyltransferase/uncharacterized protein YbaR (Trm112 family)